MLDNYARYTGAQATAAAPVDKDAQAARLASRESRIMSQNRALQKTIYV